MLGRVIDRLHTAGTRVVLSNVNDPVRAQLDRYGLVAALGPNSFYDTSGEVLADYPTGPERKDDHG